MKPRQTIQELEKKLTNFLEKNPENLPPEKLNEVKSFKNLDAQLNRTGTTSKSKIWYKDASTLGNNAGGINLMSHSTNPSHLEIILHGYRSLLSRFRGAATADGLTMSSNFCLNLVADNLNRLVKNPEITIPVRLALHDYAFHHGFLFDGKLSHLDEMKAQLALIDKPTDDMKYYFEALDTVQRLIRTAIPAETKEVAPLKASFFTNLISQVEQETKNEIAAHQAKGLLKISSGFYSAKNKTPQSLIAASKQYAEAYAHFSTPSPHIRRDIAIFYLLELRDDVLSSADPDTILEYTEILCHCLSKEEQTEDLHNLYPLHTNLIVILNKNTFFSLSDIKYAGNLSLIYIASIARSLASKNENAKYLAHKLKAHLVKIKTATKTVLGQFIAIENPKNLLTDPSYKLFNEFINFFLEPTSKALAEIKTSLMLPTPPPSDFFSWLLQPETKPTSEATFYTQLSNSFGEHRETILKDPARLAAHLIKFLEKNAADLDIKSKALLQTGAALARQRLDEKHHICDAATLFADAYHTLSAPSIQQSKVYNERIIPLGYLTHLYSDVITKDEETITHYAEKLCLCFEKETQIYSMLQNEDLRTSALNNSYKIMIALITTIAASKVLASDAARQRKFIKTNEEKQLVETQVEDFFAIRFIRAITNTLIYIFNQHNDSTEITAYYVLHYLQQQESCIRHTEIKKVFYDCMADCLAAHSSNDNQILSFREKALVESKNSDDLRKKYAKSLVDFADTQNHSNDPKDIVALYEKSHSLGNIAAHIHLAEFHNKGTRASDKELAATAIEKALLEAKHLSDTQLVRAFQMATNLYDTLAQSSPNRASLGLCIEDFVIKNKVPALLSEYLTFAKQSKNSLLAADLAAKAPSFSLKERRNLLEAIRDAKSDREFDALKYQIKILEEQTQSIEGLTHLLKIVAEDKQEYCEPLYKQALKEWVALNIMTLDASDSIPNRILDQYTNLTQFCINKSPLADYAKKLIYDELKKQPSVFGYRHICSIKRKLALTNKSDAVLCHQFANAIRVLLFESYTNLENKFSAERGKSAVKFVHIPDLKTLDSCAERAKKLEQRQTVLDIIEQEHNVYYNQYIKLDDPMMMFHVLSFRITEMNRFGAADPDATHQTILCLCIKLLVLTPACTEAKTKPFTQVEMRFELEEDYILKIRTFASNILRQWMNISNLTPRQQDLQSLARWYWNDFLNSKPLQNYLTETNNYHSDTVIDAAFSLSKFPEKLRAMYKESMGKFYKYQIDSRAFQEISALLKPSFQTTSELKGAGSVARLSMMTSPVKSPKALSPGDAKRSTSGVEAKI